PEWTFSFSGMTSGDLNLLTGLEFETARMRDPRAVHKPGESASKQVIVPLRRFSEPKRATLIPNRHHVYFQGVREAVALSDYDSQSWTVKIPYEGFVLALGRQRETGEGAFWTRPLGSGRIVVSGLGTLFTNRALGLADNARLLSNIIGANL